MNFYQKNVQKFYIDSRNFYTKRGCRKTVYVLYFVADVNVTGIFISELLRITYQVGLVCLESIRKNYQYQEVDTNDKGTDFKERNFITV